MKLTKNPRDLIDRGAGWEEAAEQVFAACSRRERDQLAQERLADLAWGYQRALDRQRERAVRDAMRRVPLRELDRETANALLNTEFALPGGVRVSWRSASPDDHDMRAKSQEVQAATLLDDAAMHRAVASMLRERGFVCLGDVPWEDWSEFMTNQHAIAEYRRIGPLWDRL